MIGIKEMRDRRAAMEVLPVAAKKRKSPMRTNLLGVSAVFCGAGVAKMRPKTTNPARDPPGGLTARPDAVANRVPANREPGVRAACAATLIKIKKTMTRSPAVSWGVLAGAKTRKTKRKTNPGGLLNLPKNPGAAARFSEGLATMIPSAKQAAQAGPARSLRAAGVHSR
jgi:hypothetical protein